MKRVGMVTLITEKPEARGVLDVPTESRRRTYCEEKSLSMSEVYQARASGFSPVFRLVLNQGFEYKGETICEYKGERYRIIREYYDDKTGDGTELTLERIRGNAAAQERDEPEPEETENETAQGEPAETGGTAEDEPAPGEGGDGT